MLKGIPLLLVVSPARVLKWKCSGDPCGRQALLNVVATLAVARLYYMTKERTVSNH
jgi:hypothetical protein